VDRLQPFRRRGRRSIGQAVLIRSIARTSAARRSARISRWASLGRIACSIRSIS